MTVLQIFCMKIKHDIFPLYKPLIFCVKNKINKSEFMEKTMMDKKTQKIGVICSIVQIILSIIFLIYSVINQENIIMWVLFLCSGILSLSSNISRNNKKEDE